MLLLFALFFLMMRTLRTVRYNEKKSSTTAMAKVHIHKDLITRLQNEYHWQMRYIWLYGTIQLRNDGKHIHISHYSHNYIHHSENNNNNNNNLLGWALVDTGQMTEDIVKTNFRHVHGMMMKQFIKQETENSKINKLFSSLIALTISMSVSTESRTTLSTQIMKNQIQVYSVYVPEAYMMALFEACLQKHATFDHVLNLRRDLSLIIHSGQMSQFYEQEKNMNLRESLDSLDANPNTLDVFGNRYFDIERVEEFCEQEMDKHEELLDVYSKEYQKTIRMTAILNYLTQYEARILQSSTTETRKNNDNNNNNNNNNRIS
jgi:hypothetical protein